MLVPFAFAVFVWAASTCVGYTTMQIEDKTFNMGILKALCPLILMGWINHLNFKDKLLFPCICISIISIVVMIAMLNNSILENVLYSYFTTDNGLMMISRREFLGISIASAFYRSTPILIIPLAKATQQVFEKRTYKRILIFIILLLGLFAGGNRACILSAIGIPVTIYIYKLYASHKLNQFLLSVVIFSLTGVVLLFNLLIETQETSNAIKFGHLESYINFFNDNYWTFIFGQGPGGLMYSIGFKGYSVQTEWTYIELIRYFGLIGAFVVVLIYSYPLVLSIKNYKALNPPAYFIVGYVFYLIVAGTNPLLLSSTGVLVCYYYYSCIFYKNDERVRGRDSHVIV